VFPIDPTFRNCKLREQPQNIKDFNFVVLNIATVLLPDVKQLLMPSAVPVKIKIFVKKVLTQL
jgi:hypothetical protein